jgi:uncharacterized protein
MKKVLIITFLSLACMLYTKAAFSIDVGIDGLGSRIHKPVRTLKEIKQQHIVRQSLDFSCGPASLATLLSYYFQDTVTEQQIIKALILTTDLKKIKQRKGFSLLDLKNFAELRGYKVTGYRMDLDYLVSLDQPVLVPLKIKTYNHFVIFRGMNGDRVFIADPALGNMSMKADRFLSLWQGGIGLVLSNPGKRNPNAPLRLSKEEQAIFADPAMVRRIFGIDLIGNVYSEGDF